MEIEIEALKIVNQYKIFRITGFEEGIDKVFKGFNIEKIKLTNMHPYHVFAITGKLKYKINC